MPKVNQKYYSDGQLKHEIPYKGTNRYGIARWWHKNGQLECKESYHNGQLHGMVNWWHSDGQSKRKVYYLHDKKVTEEEYRKYELIEELACLE